MNPFVQNIKLSVLQIDDSFTLTSTAKVEIGALPKKIIIPNNFFIERIQKTSVFHLPNILDVLYKQLRPAGRDLFQYVTVMLKKELDYIELIHKKVCEDMNDISRGTLHSGITQLTQAGIICKRDPKTYWINPLYIYNGNRIDYFRKLGPDYIDIIIPANHQNRLSA